MKYNLLNNKYPIIANPDLAKRIGLNEAIVLQKFNFLIQRNIETKNPRSYHDGKYWTFNPMQVWKDKYFYWWSESTVKRTISSLKKQQLIITDNFNKKKFDNTRWYTVNFNNEKLIKVEKQSPVQNEPSASSNRTSGQVQNEPDKTIDYPYNTQESSKDDQHVLKKAKGVIDMLDEKANKSFRYGKNNMSFIKARIKQGYSNKDFAYVIMNKAAEWKNTEMDKFIRPKTLFTEQHMEDYLNEKPVFEDSSTQGRAQSNNTEQKKSTKQIQDEREQEELETERKLKEQMKGQDNNE